MPVTPSNLFDSNGASVRFGRRLGVGGEGAVYEIAGSKDLVAKVYHKSLPQQKQDKLIGMVRECDDTLKRISAWPSSALHQGKNGRVCGFIMPKVSGFEPIHKLYSPAHRKQFFQKADWAFLVNAARNVAAVFETMHARGHVVGDVNYGNVFVAENSFIKLIDCDSFQITVGGRSYLCEVGVAHFTPPELHALKSFQGVVRTENHDNFGLALLCFHLLFMGRHPFSGVYSGKEDMPIERAIKEFRFAFGRDALSKGMKPPPNSLDMNFVTPTLSPFFEQAFSEAGLKTRRPKAKEWVHALESLKKQIRTCQVEPAHKFVEVTGICPWCALEQKTGVIFFIRTVIVQGGTAVFNLTHVWERILSVGLPGSAPVIDLNLFKATPTPLPENLRRAKRNQILKRILAVLIVVGVFITAPKAGIIYIIVFIAALTLFFSKIEDSTERKARINARNLAESKWVGAEDRWKKEAGEGLFNEKLGELHKLKSQYENLAGEYEKEKKILHSTIRQRQLYRFLDGFFIEGQWIKGIGSSRKALLASFGIETAADIDYFKIIQISGFGKSLAGELVNWRKGIEGKFLFNPSKGIDKSDIDALNQKFSNLRRQIEGCLLAGEEELKKLKHNALMKRQSLRKEIEAVARTYVQTIADASIISPR
jgi:DNA-binding helix-hairpin-helix protein with protein kinase domain